MKHLLLVVMLVAISLLAVQTAFAEPTGDLVYLKVVRPYMQTNNIYVVVDSSALCGTDTFIIDRTAPGGEETYIAAITAISNQMRVQLEVSNVTVCTGIFPSLQSIYVTSN